MDENQQHLYAVDGTTLVCFDFQTRNFYLKFRNHKTEKMLWNFTYAISFTVDLENDGRIYFINAQNSEDVSEVNIGVLSPNGSLLWQGESITLNGS